MNTNFQQDNNEVKVKFENLAYSIRPINLHDPTHLKCIIGITNDKNSHQCIDSLDLYRANARRLFTNKMAPRLETDASWVETHLVEIVNRLENRRNRSGTPTEIEIPPESKKEALAYLKDPNLLDLIIADYKNCGYVGEENNFLTGYLVATSRKLAKPLGMIIISRSGAGKSTIQGAIISFMPPEDCLVYTRITNLAFFYKDRFALKNKLISIEEEKGAIGASYALRSLLNGEGLTSTATIKDPVTGRMRSTDQIVEGPSSLLIGTTGSELDHETLSRFIVRTIDESMEQTRRILARQREQDTLRGHMENRARESILIRHHNIQRLLQPIAIINTHAPQLNFPDDRLIMRRGQLQYHKLIKTICLLRQYQREIKIAKDFMGEFQYIEVTERDIDLANKIAPDVLGMSLDELSPITRQFLGELKQLIAYKMVTNGGTKSFTRRDIREFTKWNDYQIRQSLRELENLEYIIRTNGCQGKLCTYELIYGGGEDSKIKLGLSDTVNNDIERQICQTLRRKTVLCEDFANGFRKV